MTFKRFLPLAFAAGIAIVPALTTTPALADYGTDAAVGAAVGAVVGALLFDTDRNQYYYYEGPRPIYVSDGYARRWFQHRDPDYWRMHRHEFRESHAGFAHEWENDHHGWHHGDRDGHHDDHDWHHDDHDRNHDDHDRNHGDHGDER